MEQAKKDCILQAATRAFGRFGFKKASVDEIARDAGVAKGTVYLACESKEDLFYQAVHREVRALVAELSRRIDPRVPADELMRELSRATVAYIAKHPLVRDLFHGIYHGQLPGWADRFEELHRLGHTHVVEVLRLGMKQGRFRADLDLEETATAIQDLQLAGLTWYSRTGGGGPERMLRRSQAGFALVLDGIRARATQ